MMQFSRLTQNQIHDIAKPIWDNILDASNKQDYPKFSKDFSQKMSQQVGREDVEQQWQAVPVLSNLSPDPEFMGYLLQQNGVRVLWKQKSSLTDDELLGHLELTIENGRVKVDGAQVL